MGLGGFATWTWACLWASARWYSGDSPAGTKILRGGFVARLDKESGVGDAGGVAAVGFEVLVRLVVVVADARGVGVVGLVGVRSMRSMRSPSGR
jgi:hypothetical protein